MSKLDPYLDDIANFIAQGRSQRELAKKYGVARSTLGDFIKKHSIVTPEFLGALYVTPEGTISETEKLRAELADVKKAARLSRKLDVQAELVLDEVRTAIPQAAPKYEAPSPPDDAYHKHHVQALLLSDLHGGEVVTPESVNGMNEYNWDILGERMAKIHESLVSYQAARPYPIDELHLWLLGDMCSGSNHGELVETNEFSAAEQGVQVGKLLGLWIEELVPYYPRIKVHGVVGNHPRVPHKPQAKNVWNNFDWVAYVIAETHLAQYESVECNFPHAGMQIVEIAGLNVLLFHGDGIRSTMPGVPWGGVMRRVKELKTQYAEGGTQIDGFALGHFHSANAVAGNVWMNGSVKGVDEYSLKSFGYGQAPTQLLLTFEPSKARLTDVSYITPG